ncbi:ATP-dependent zinc metalloprotease FtsH [Streptomyces sp. SP17BM10]|uniref:ATP-dependent zinc metalloprotease FtsH n=1 Tax=Streptomyces sp. SP17BM10 TaxID=3002530 RepID=UPI002E77606A|nr:ATP-dependent zinc metalloprotease FtsH [Streptomyces sp. SP17BM10]MEE1788740.1 ATP-dependent zinc metalloprotease FtsH [Streptomyces sp. SP17BM10]
MTGRIRLRATRHQATRDQATRHQATRDQATRDQATRHQATRHPATPPGPSSSGGPEQGPSGPGPFKPRPPQSKPPPPPGVRRWLLPVGALLALILLLVVQAPGPAGTRYGYSDFVGRVDAGQVKTVNVTDTGGVSGTLKDGTRFTSQIPTALDTTRLSQSLATQHVDVTGSRTGGSSIWSTLLLFLPLLVFGGLFLWSGRLAARTMTGGLSAIGRSRAKIIEAERPATGFADVAGYEGVKQEVSEVVDYLRSPGRYAAAGAKGPRGVIMVGPPGTGKTLLARAVAGEAEVPFLSVTGSGFVEMFVGVGASRVRDLFDDARKRAPSIIFIDEIDAVGGRRAGGSRLGGNDEREQTLNQLLAEMDGFDQSTGIVVIAATNRPDALDPALLRPGRFDRQVTVPLPNQRERAAILAVHVRGKTLAPDADLDRIARGTPGFSGADLANLVNEAAINAVRADRATITADDLDTARDRVLLGRRESSNALLPEERHAVAVHESGHALMAALCEHADPVAKVTILPAGVALGATEQLPEAERHLYSESYLTDLLTVQLGGRAAELVVFGEGSTGAANDLANATSVATRMVREFGLSPDLGPVGYASGSPRYLGESPEDLLRRPYSEETQRAIDEAVAALLRRAEQRAIGLLREHRHHLDELAALLVAQETVNGAVVLDILRHPAVNLPE